MKNNRTTMPNILVYHSLIKTYHGGRKLKPPYKLNRGIGILRKLRPSLQEKQTIKKSVQFLHKILHRIWHTCLVISS